MKFIYLIPSVVNQSYKSRRQKGSRVQHRGPLFHFWRGISKIHRGILNEPAETHLNLH